MYNEIANKFIFIACFLHFVNSRYGSENDDRYQWFNIVSHQWECRCQLAIDVDSFQQNCEGTGVVACPLDPNKKSQQWRWVGDMLINRATGLAMDSEKLGRGRIVMSEPTNSPTQQFATYNFDSHIWGYNNKFQHPQVLDVHQRPGTLIGTDIIRHDFHTSNLTNQLFDIRRVPKGTR